MRESRPGLLVCSEKGYWLLGSYSRGGWALSSPVSAALAMAMAGLVMAVVYFAALLFARNPQALAFIAPLARRFRGAR